MVRINLISPRKLADQHLIAEYNEILMLFGYLRKYPKADNITENYCLGKGHIRFFKNKLLYLKKRHESIKKEMRRRGFKANKTINLEEFDEKLLNCWKPKSSDKEMIKKRIVERLNEKPEYYSYYRKKMPSSFLLDLIKK